jgi:hypothetical protein
MVPRLMVEGKGYFDSAGELSTKEAAGSAAQPPSGSLKG